MTVGLSERIKAARLRAGLSMEDLAKLLNLSKQSVYKFEKDQLTPNPEVLHNIALYLNIPINELFSKEKRLEQVSFRSGVEEAMIKLSSIEDEVIEEMELTTELEALTKDTIVFDNPLKHWQIKDLSDVERAAAEVRLQWQLGFAPISNIVGVLENKGICVVEKNSQYDYEGFSAFYQGKPIIVLNTKTQEITRKRFTALHELGHILLGSIVVESLKDNIEQICDTFAGALLLPEQVLKQFWKGRTKFLMQDFISLKETFGISIQAIWRRAVHLKLLSWESLHKWKEAYQAQPNYGNYMGSESPRRLELLMLKCLANGKITYDQGIEKVKGLKNNLDKTLLVNLKYSLSI
ncbi:XRE family transcriptional regulator [Flavisolibacter tropicus]|uniref:HTH cro/C1-type domain-containing protein n=1 Tax=Flavisolibacter tropicus TaxID=1492898 RepID=A0A172TV18_9BACT|nr:XRE family transcriptional regulator [Flavisolibacter tropicus]ANE50623.1 hypothetical protein SY85_09040 [Flavisolibacter tropicus]